MPDLGPTVRQCPVASTVGDGDGYSLGYSIPRIRWTPCCSDTLALWPSCADSIRASLLPSGAGCVAASSIAAGAGRFRA